jgi:hypothetical protein
MTDSAENIARFVAWSCSCHLVRGGDGKAEAGVPLAVEKFRLAKCA